MNPNTLYTKAENDNFVDLAKRLQWSEATTLILEKAKPTIIRVYRNAGTVFDGNFIEEDDFLNDQWINIYQYISTDTEYLNADSPMGYVIKHIQSYILKLDGNDTKNVHLLQDTRYAGSQRVPYRHRIRSSEYKDYSLNSYEQILESKEPNQHGLDADMDSHDSDANHYFGSTDIEEEIQHNKNSYLTKQKVINMMYQEIADIKETIDIAELEYANEPVIFIDERA